MGSSGVARPGFSVGGGGGVLPERGSNFGDLLGGGGAGRGLGGRCRQALSSCSRNIVVSRHWHLRRIASARMARSAVTTPSSLGRVARATASTMSSSAVRGALYRTSTPAIAICRARPDAGAGPSNTMVTIVPDCFAQWAIIRTSVSRPTKGKNPRSRAACRRLLPSTRISPGMWPILRSHGCGRARRPPGIHALVAIASWATRDDHAISDERSRLPVSRPTAKNHRRRERIGCRPIASAVGALEVT